MDLLLTWLVGAGVCGILYGVTYAFTSLLYRWELIDPEIPGFVVQLFLVVGLMLMGFVGRFVRVVGGF